MLRSRLVATVMLGCLSVGALARGGDVSRTSAVLGHKADNFTLNDFYGKSHSLADFKDKKAIVLVFLGTECPLARQYGERLAELNKKYADKGVQFLGVNSNRQDTITEISSYARIHKVDFPILKDLNNKLADQLGASRTPEVFLLDQDRAVRYHGRIDNQYGVGYVKKTASETYLQTAIDELLAGKPVAQAETGVVGCFIGRVRAADNSAKVTYSNQVSRILNKHCVTCHRDGEAAPFAMSKYEEVSGWADAIAEVVQQRRMPPWLADPKYGHFTNDCSLSENEKQTLYQWAAAGAPEGDPKELPAAPTFVDGWKLPKAPDAVFYDLKKEYSVPATGVVDYQYFAVDPGFKEDKWIKAIEARPSDRAVVHHIIVFSQPKGSRDEGRRQFLIGYAPGAVPLVLPKGYAKMIPAGSELLFQMHFTPNGKPGQDRSRVGLVFADPKEVTHLVRTVEAINTGFEIPAGADNYKVEANSFAFPFDADLVQLFPHMHFRGKQFDYEARYPDGKTEILLDVPNYQFAWQLTYELSSFKHLPKGTVMHCTAHFDNSDNNPNNPDPKSMVRWGDQTWEEMMIGFYDIAVALSPSDIQNHNLPNFNPGADEIAQRILERFDKNHDGKVSQKELPLSNMRLKLMFMAMDKDKNGEITREEIANAIRERMKSGESGRGFGRRIGRRGQNADSSHSKDGQKPAEGKPAGQKTPNGKDQASAN
jgi:peroxiredoxin